MQHNITYKIKDNLIYIERGKIKYKLGQAWFANGIHFSFYHMKYKYYSIKR